MDFKLDVFQKFLHVDAVFNAEYALCIIRVFGGMGA